jgi:hypothetical protein
MKISGKNEKTHKKRLDEKVMECGSHTRDRVQVGVSETERQRDREWGWRE